MDFQRSAAPVAFLYTVDRERALAFYQGIFGAELRTSDPFGDFLDVGGTLVRMTTSPDHQAAPHPVLGWDVPDIRAAAEWLLQKGVEFTFTEGSGQDEFGIWTAPDGKLKVAYFLDPDGNVLTLSQTSSRPSARGPTTGE